MRGAHGAWRRRLGTPLFISVFCVPLCGSLDLPDKCCPPCSVGWFPFFVCPSRPISFPFVPCVSHWCVSPLTTRIGKQLSQRGSPGTPTAPAFTEYGFQPRRASWLLAPRPASPTRRTSRAACAHRRGARQRWSGMERRRRPTVYYTYIRRVRTVQCSAHAHKKKKWRRIPPSPRAPPFYHSAAARTSRASWVLPALGAVNQSSSAPPTGGGTRP